MSEQGDTVQEPQSFQLPPDTIIQDEAVFKAIKGHRTHRVFPVDHEHHRTWLMCGEIGSVTIHDAGNGYCQIVTVEPDSQEDEMAFWNRLAEMVSKKPHMVHAIEPGFITDLLVKAGLYNPDLLMNS